MFYHLWPAIAPGTSETDETFALLLFLRVLRALRGGNILFLLRQMIPKIKAAS